MNLERQAKDLAMQYGLIGMEDDLAAAIIKLAREIEKSTLERASKAALNYGYMLDYNREHQPWSHDANTWLRIQNRVISDQILALAEEKK